MAAGRARTNQNDIKLAPNRIEDDQPISMARAGQRDSDLRAVRSMVRRGLRALRGGAASGVRAAGGTAYSC